MHRKSIAWPSEAEKKSKDDFSPFREKEHLCSSPCILSHLRLLLKYKQQFFLFFRQFSFGDVPLEEVYGVSTFYSQFSLNPKGKVAIAVDAD